VWERTYKEWKGRGVEFVGIGLLDSKERSADFVRRHGLTFPNGFDPDGRIARAYGFNYQPHWAVVDRTGMLVRSGFGPRDGQDLVAAVRAVVGR
jgi:peroxiredoxin